MEKTMIKKPDTQALANEVAAEANADILIYNGPIGRDSDRDMIFECRKRRRRPNIILFLITAGGDPDAAYRLSRCFQRRYKNFCCCISGYCKSAGTLVVLGAHELILLDNGEIGPIDVQMAKRDELWEMESGQVVMTSLTTLQEKAFSTFEHFFLTLKGHAGRSITLRTAADLATRLTTGLFAEVYKQIDPKHIGEAGRAMSIAHEYGQRLRRVSKNFSLETLDRIVSGYPSHGFVIDRAEMSQLFLNTRHATKKERALVELLGQLAYEPVDAEDGPYVEFLNEELKEAADAKKTTGEQPGEGVGTELRQAAAVAGGGSSSNGDPQ
jgi:hypothetical protein